MYHESDNFTRHNEWFNYEWIMIFQLGNFLLTFCELKI